MTCIAPRECRAKQVQIHERLLEVRSVTTCSSCPRDGEHAGEFSDLTVAIEAVVADIFGLQLSIASAKQHGLRLSADDHYTAVVRNAESHNKSHANVYHGHQTCAKNVLAHATARSVRRRHHR